MEGFKNFWNQYKGGEIMKEATGEVSMTVVTLVAIAVIGAILALFWGPITNKISSLWGAGGSNAGGNIVLPK